MPGSPQTPTWLLHPGQRKVAEAFIAFHLAMWDSVLCLEAGKDASLLTQSQEACGASQTQPEPVLMDHLTFPRITWLVASPIQKASQNQEMS